MSPVTQRLLESLRNRGVPFQVLEHAAVFTSEEAARVRGTTLASGAKALVCKADDRFVLIVIPAHLKLHSKQVRATLGLKSLRFASGDEVQQLTALLPGSIPPFGSLFGLATWCDRRLSESSQINFNAGDHRVSVSMSFADFLIVESPILGDYAQPPPEDRPSS